LPQYTLWTNRQRDRPTDRLTDKTGDKSVRRVLTLYYIDSERRGSASLTIEWSAYVIELSLVPSVGPHIKQWQHG